MGVVEGDGVALGVCEGVIVGVPDSDGGSRETPLSWNPYMVADATQPPDFEKRKLHGVVHAAAPKSPYAHAPVLPEAEDQVTGPPLPPTTRA